MKKPKTIKVKPKRIKVQIIAKQDVYYNQIVELTQEELTELKESIDDFDCAKDSSPISDYCELSDVLCTGEFSEIQLIYK